MCSLAVGWKAVCLVIFDEEELEELKKATRNLKWWRLALALPFVALMAVMMLVAYPLLLATYFVCFTAVQIQGFSGPENKKLQHFRLWVKGECFVCQQVKEFRKSLDEDRPT
jgi:hypothetical protein